jgi:DNA ligase D-like protein (predicted ligase)
MPRTVARQRAKTAALPAWVVPQLTQLVETAPDGDQWLHEIKYDGYRMHARLDPGAVKLLTRTGLDWTHKYPAIAKAVAALDARQAYLDGELCGVGPDGITSFNIVQLASDSGNAAALVFFLFDLLYLDGEDLCERSLIERKERLKVLLAAAAPCLHYSDHVIGQGPAFYDKACTMQVEGIVSKRADAPYTPGNRGLWRKVKCLNRAEFVVVGWTDPEGSRPYLGACCSPTMIPTNALSMPAAPAPVSNKRSWRDCGAGCSPSRPPRCRSRCRRRVTAASDCLSC